jgi:PadR family transcriptional regulator PadR
VEHSGRNRRYYKITNKGKLQLALYREEWEIFKKKIDYVLKGDDDDEQV